MHGNQAIVLLQLHISAVDREVHHSRHKTTPFLPYVRGRPARGACTRAHTLRLRKFRARAGARAHAHVNVRVHGLVYTHAVNVHLYVCAQLYNFFYGALPQMEKMSVTSVKIISMK